LDANFLWSISLRADEHVSAVSEQEIEIESNKYVIIAFLISFDVFQGTGVLITQTSSHCSPTHKKNVEFKASLI
jgi:hypothetical protein